MARTTASKTICLSFASETDYLALLNDQDKFRQHLDVTFTAHPELFPAAFKQGYKLNGFVQSKKQDIAIRRIRLLETDAAYQIRPSFLMPYMIARTEDVEKPLYLRRWGVPFEALAYVFGHDPMFWYRAYVALGRNSLVGTTVKAPETLPSDVLADEKHTRQDGETVYLATTVAEECILGAALADTADAPALTEAYRIFQTEAREVDLAYSPQSVNTDGWTATQQSWLALFPNIAIILCFLHSFFKIRDCCRRWPGQLKEISQKVWHAYHAQTLPEFAQRIRRLREWATEKVDDPVREKVLALCAKAPQFKLAFEFPTAHRTSNMLDRLMNYQDRLLYSMQYLHGTRPSATLYVRAMALVWNFHPYGEKTQAKYETEGLSPFEQLNGFRYHDNWLQNLLIAASLGGHPTQTQNP